ncbi:hypothetical protein LSAT2_014319 [Lamellibrachia satsuma]|nr:hypothetical protein LSAT2_014319 [Lamellibrachia satsuma]
MPASFHREFVAARCNTTYYETSCGMKCLPDISTTGTTICRTPCDAPVLSVHQKYSRPLAVAKDFGSLAAEEGMVTFKERLAFLKDIAGQTDQALPLPVHAASSGYTPHFRKTTMAHDVCWCGTAAKPT